MGQTEAALSALGEALRLVPEDAHTRVAALRLAHRLGPDERFVAHGEALLALPAAQWVTATETDPAWLRSPEALGEALKAARGPR
jgi:hypothetical protein